jgi:DNA-binding MarR family transcriptional regulator
MRLVSGHDSDLVATWRDLMARHAAVTCALDRVLHEMHGLGVSEFEVLDRLAGTTQKQRVQELAEAVHLSQSALSRTVARLEKDGLVDRCMCAEDRRGIWVSLTEAGRARHAAAQPTQRAVLAEYLDEPAPVTR